MRNGRKASWLELAVLGILGTLKLASNAPAQEAKPAENPLKDLAAKTYVMPSEKTEAPKLVEDKKWTLYLESTVATDYVFGNGMVIGRDPGKHTGVDQTLFSATNGNLCAFLWSDFDFNDWELHEVDAAVDYTLLLGKSFSVTGGFYTWHYPSKFICDESDWVLHGAAAYNGPVKLEAGLLELLPHDDIKSGTCLTVKASKEFALGKTNGWDVKVTPSLEAGLTHHFYDDTSGLKAVTPGIDLTLAQGPWGIKVFYRDLDGKDGVDDIQYGGVSFSYAFP